MNDQKQNIKPIYKVMILAIVLSFVLALSVVPAFADDPQVTNLIGTTWRLGGDISQLSAAYGIFNVLANGTYSIYEDGVIVEGQTYTVSSETFYCGYSYNTKIAVDGMAYMVLVNVPSEQSEMPIGVFPGDNIDFVYEFTITGGTDISNPLFIDFINTYGTLVSDGEDVTTPTIYDIWDDILEWMVNAAENMTAAFYYNEQLTLLGILCVIPLSLGLVILIVKIFEEWISLR